MKTIHYALFADLSWVTLDKLQCSFFTVIISVAFCFLFSAHFSFLSVRFLLSVSETHYLYLWVQVVHAIIFFTVKWNEYK